jgi:hypothetical protein
MIKIFIHFNQNIQLGEVFLRYLTSKLNNGLFSGHQIIIVLLRTIGATFISSHLWGGMGCRNLVIHILLSSIGNEEENITINIIETKNLMNLS